jgi:phosphoribosyl 1,2-cyclic phosphodiesterase
VKTFNEHIAVQIGGLSVTGFTKQHDAADPYSFIISYNKITVGVFTDIGIACKNVIHYFKQCHAVFLEANYDETLLDNGRYPIHLKNRIRGGQGHLSNRQALELFVTHRPPFMTHLLLSHLSKENNSPQLAAELFTTHANGIHIILASRYEASPVYPITITGAETPLRRMPVKPFQLDLFA